MNFAKKLKNRKKTRKDRKDKSSTRPAILKILTIFAKIVDFAKGAKIVKNRRDREDESATKLAIFAILTILAKNRKDHESARTSFWNKIL